METSQERRYSRYTFISQKDLIRFFTNWISEGMILKIIDDSKKNFIIRADASALDTKLQFIKKCEIAMNKLLSSKKKH